MMISAQPQANIVTPVSALGRPVVGNESLEAKATALPPVEQTSSSDKALNRPAQQAVLAKPDAAMSAALATSASTSLTNSAVNLATTVSLTGSAADKSNLGKAGADKPIGEQKSLAAIGRESLAKALDAADIDPAVVSADASDQPIAASNNTSGDSAVEPIEAQGAKASSQSNQNEPPQAEQNERKQGQIAETGFTEEELQVIQQLAARDREVRAHEQAHSAVGGDIAGSPSYTYKRGPDGVLYAVGGEVSISVSEVPNNPQATLRKAEKVQRAALAPADPSPQDRRVAALAARMAAQARAELAAQSSEALSTNDSNLSSSVRFSRSPSIESTDSANQATSARPLSASDIYRESGPQALNNSDYSNTGYTRGYVSERASLQDPNNLNEFYIASLNGQDRQGQQVDFRV